MKTHVLTTALLIALTSQAALAASESLPQVEVTAPARNDAAITTEVQQRISEHPSLRFFDINVRSVDRAVYLEGQVDTRLDSAVARRVAQQVPGVKTVYNDLYFNND